MAKACGLLIYIGQHASFWYLSHMRNSNIITSILRVCEHMSHCTNVWYTSYADKGDVSDGIID